MTTREGHNTNCPHGERIVVFGQLTPSALCTRHQRTPTPRKSLWVTHSLQRPLEVATLALWSDMAASSYQWPALCRTFLLWFSFFSIGISDSVRGPTLLDLRDLISVETSEISTTFALRSLGGLLGSMATGLLLDRLSRASRYLILGLCFSVSGFCTAFLPHAPSLILMQVI